MEIEILRNKNCAMAFLAEGRRKCAPFDDPRNRDAIHASDFFQETEKTQAHLTETG